MLTAVRHFKKEKPLSLHNVCVSRAVGARLSRTLDNGVLDTEQEARHSSSLFAPFIRLDAKGARRVGRPAHTIVS